MTEKRFKVYKVSGNFREWEVEDTVTDTVVMDMIIHKYLADRLCEKLNELNDENEQLKKEINKWKQMYYDSTASLIYETSSTIRKDLDELYNEVYGGLNE